MNIKNIAMLLGDISIGSVAYGEHAMLRLNQELPSSYRIVPTMSGVEIEERLQDFPSELLEQVSELRLLSSPETQKFLSALFEARENKERLNEIEDKGPIVFTVVTGVGSVVLGFLVLMYYVFVAKQSNDPISGVFVDAATELSKFIMQLVRNYLGIKPGS